MVSVQSRILKQFASRGPDFRICSPALVKRDKTELTVPRDDKAELVFGIHKHFVRAEIRGLSNWFSNQTIPLFYLRGAARARVLLSTNIIIILSENMSIVKNRTRPLLLYGN
jgi:hypothetical protein